MNLPLPSSVEGAIATFCGIVSVTVVGATRIATAIENWKRRKAAKSVPPIAPHVPPHELGRRLDTIERLVANQRLWREEELQRELSQTIKELGELRQDNDQLRAARAADRLEVQRLKRELERLKSERD